MSYYINMPSGRFFFSNRTDASTAFCMLAGEHGFDVDWHDIFLALGGRIGCKKSVYGMRAVYLDANDPVHGYFIEIGRVFKRACKRRYRHDIE